MNLSNNFETLQNNQLENIDGGFVITIGTAVITGTALAKGCAAIGAAYSAGYVLGKNWKNAK
ncbi:class IIb bacteriocin, lactobin A/cerein 7B family [Clostridium botulinum]|nr:class IIb bacteriocin, lactobin A/cerein 7B family [Clostridium botulinum]